MRFFTNSGSRKKPIRRSHFDEFGRLEVVTVGYDDIQAYINSFADSVDVSRLVELYTRGDSSALNQVEGFFGDFVDAPSSFPDLLNRITDLQFKFNSLPASVRDRFGNDFNVFISSSTRPDFLSNFSVPPAMDSTVDDAVIMNGGTPVEP